MATEIAAQFIRAILHDEIHPLSGSFPNTPPSATWEEVLSLTIQWGVLPLFYTALREKGLAPPAPDPVERRLRELYHANVAQSIDLFGRQLLSLLGELRRADIPVVALKGIHLGGQIYPHHSLRPMSDVDLWVPEDVLPAVDAVMTSLGYTAGKYPHAYHIQYRSSERPFPVEIHWRLQREEEAARLDGTGMWRRARQTRLAGGPVQVMAAEDLLIYVCWHATNHFYKTGLRALCDVRAILRHFDDKLDWTAVAARSQTWRVRRPVYLTLLLAAETLGTAVPSHVLRRLRPPDYYPQLLQWAQAEILGRQHPLSLNLAATWGDGDWQTRYRTLRHSLFPPEAIMHRLYGAPRRSLRRYLYYPRRWLDLWRRYGRVIWHLARGHPETVGRATLAHWLR